MGFIPKKSLMHKNLPFIVSGALACACMPVYAQACIKHVYIELKGVHAYACMHEHALGFLLSFFSKNSLFSS